MKMDKIVEEVTSAGPTKVFRRISRKYKRKA